MIPDKRIDLPSAEKEAKAYLAEESRWDLLTPISLVILCVMSVLFIHSAQAYVGGGAVEDALTSL